MRRHLVWDDRQVKTLKSIYSEIYYITDRLSSKHRVIFYRCFFLGKLAKYNTLDTHVNFQTRYERENRIAFSLLISKYRNKTK